MKKTILISLILLTCSLIFGQGKGSIIIEIDAIENNTGDIKAGLFQNEEGFPDDVTKAFKVGSAKIKDGKSVITFNEIPFGTYVLAVFHDENSNKQLDKNSKGVPVEPLGISNNVKLKFGPPKYQAAVFETSQPKHTQQISLQRYRAK